MDVTDTAIARIPDRNLRVPREEFAAVWRQVESLHDALLPNPMDRNAMAGIAVVCRWLALAYPIAPVTGRAVAAAPWEVEIEADTLAAAIDAHSPPEWLIKPTGWATGVAAALDWAWQGGDLPLIRHTDRVAVHD